MKIAAVRLMAQAKAMVDSDKRKRAALDCTLSPLIRIMLMTVPRMRAVLHALPRSVR